MSTKPRTIYLPALERSVTLAQYVDAIRLAKANMDREFKHGLTTWWPTMGAVIVKQFRDGLNQRISEAIPYYRRGLL